MALFLSPYRGAGTRQSPFRPNGLREPGASAVDIRLDPTVADGGGIGFALLWLPSGLPDPVGAIKLADDYGDVLTNQQRTRLNQRTGLDFSIDATIQDAIETILLRPDIGRWRRLRPVKGMYELWLGSGTGKRLWVNLPVVAGGSISDNFNRANEAPIASPWVELASSAGEMRLTSNALTKFVTNDQLYLYYSHGSGWNADQSSQFQFVTGTTDNAWGPAVRIGSNGFSGYYWDQYSGGRAVVKFVAGTYSEVEAASGSTATGVPYKIDVAGSTIRYYDNGVEHASSPATDTSLSTAGNGAGIWCWDSGIVVDDFLATGEVGAAGTNPKGPLSNPFAGPFGGPI